MIIACRTSKIIVGNIKAGMTLYDLILMTTIRYVIPTAESQRIKAYYMKKLRVMARVAGRIVLRLGINVKNTIAEKLLNIEHIFDRNVSKKEKVCNQRIK